MAPSLQTVIPQTYQCCCKTFEICYAITTNSTRVPGANKHMLDQNIQQQAHPIVAQSDRMHNTLVTATTANSATIPAGVTERSSWPKLDLSNKREWGLLMGVVHNSKKLKIDTIMTVKRMLWVTTMITLRHCFCTRLQF